MRMTAQMDRSAGAVYLWVLLCGSLLAASMAQAADTGFTIKQYVVDGPNPLSTDETAAILQPYVGVLHSLEDLSAAAKGLEKGLRAKGLIFYRVTLPAQTIEQETVKLTLVPLRVGEVTVTGNAFGSAENARRALPHLAPSTTPTMKYLARDLVVANEQPSRHLALNLKESARPDTIDAEVQVKDERPWTAFTNLSNVGTPELARTRLSLGFQHTNLFDRDHAATLIYTTSPEAASDVVQFAFNYRVPIYAWGGSASTYYVHSDVNNGRIQDVFDVSGAGDFYGFAYNQYLFPIGDYSHQVGIAIDDRSFTNEVSFLGLPIGTDVRSRPLTFRYEGEYRSDKFVAGWNINYVHNIVAGDKNDRRSYLAARSAASPNWQLLRIGAQVTYALPRGWQARGVFDSQVADEPLISGEQFGVGGANSVRGFEERGLSGDDGQRISLEIWTPTLPYQVRLLGFVDAGVVDRARPQPGDVAHDAIVSTGVGLRWQWQRYFSVAINYGYAIEESFDHAAGGNKVDFSLLIRY